MEPLGFRHMEQLGSEPGCFRTEFGELLRFPEGTGAVIHGIHRIHHGVGGGDAQIASPALPLGLAAAECLSGTRPVSTVCQSGGLIQRKDTAVSNVAYYAGIAKGQKAQRSQQKERREDGAQYRFSFRIQVTVSLPESVSRNTRCGDEIPCFFKY